MFIKATQGDNKKGSQKATSNSDTKAQNSTKKQKETKKEWSDAAIFMEWETEVYVANVDPKQNKHGFGTLIVDGSKTHITLPKENNLE